MLLHQLAVEPARAVAKASVAEQPHHLQVKPALVGEDDAEVGASRDRHLVDQSLRPADDLPVALTTLEVFSSEVVVTPEAWHAPGVAVYPGAGQDLTPASLATA